MTKPNPTLLGKMETMALRDNRIMKVLKVSELAHDVAHTNRGQLVLKLVFGQTGKDYRFVLDAVPFSDEDNAQLIDLFGDVIVT